MHPEHFPALKLFTKLIKAISLSFLPLRPSHLPDFELFLLRFFVMAPKVDPRSKKPQPAAAGFVPKKAAPAPGKFTGTIPKKKPAASASRQLLRRR